MIRFAPRCVALSVTLFFLGVPHTVHAQQATYFANDATVNNRMIGDVVVGYRNQDDFFRRTNGTSPTFNMVDGGNCPSIYAGSGSRVNISGGYTGSLFSEGTSVVNIRGGFVDTVLAQQNSTINLTSGDVFGYLAALDHSTINISGGTSGGASGDDAHFFVARGSGTINLFGRGLSAILTDANFNGGFSTEYTLFGRLASGTSVDGKFLYVENGSNAQFHLYAVPEASSGRPVRSAEYRQCRSARPA